MIFVWTFESVMQAIGLGLCLLVFLLFAIALLVEKIQNKLRKKKSAEVLK